MNHFIYDEIANRHQKDNEKLDNSTFAQKNTASNGESDDVRHLRAIVHVLEMLAYRLKKISGKSEKKLQETKMAKNKEKQQSQKDESEVKSRDNFLREPLTILKFLKSIKRLIQLIRNRKRLGEKILKEEPWHQMKRHNNQKMHLSAR